MEHHWHVGGSSGLGTALLRPRHEEKRNKELATNAPPPGNLSPACELHEKRLSQTGPVLRKYS